MDKTAHLRIRVDRELEREAGAILSHLGLSRADFVRLSFTALVERRGLPFAARLPNAETRAAMAEDLSQARRYKSATELFADLETDP